MTATLKDTISGAASRAKGGILTAGASLATALSGAGGSCASGQCGQGCGFACGLIGTAAAVGIIGTALKRKWQGSPAQATIAGPSPAP